MEHPPRGPGALARRRVLALGASLAVVGIAGCASRSLETRPRATTAYGAPPEVTPLETLMRAHDGVVACEVQFAGTTHGIHGSPAIVGDVVYIGAYDGALHALDRFTGRSLWTYRWGDQIGSSPAVVPQWAMVFSAHERLPHGGVVVALDARTGAERWRFQTGASVLSSPAVSGDERAVVFGADDGRVYALRADTGALLWWITVGGQVSGSPSLVGDRVYVTTRNGGLTALRTHD